MTNRPTIVSSFVLIASLGRAFAADVPSTRPSLPGDGAIVTVAGSVIGSPPPVDLDGDGKPEIVVTCMGRTEGDDEPQRAPARGAVDLSARVAAFRADGTPLDGGWPVIVLSAADHAAMKPGEYPNWWLSSPTVVPASKDRALAIAVANQAGPNRKTRGVTVIRIKPNDRAGAVDSSQKLDSTLAWPDSGSTITAVDLDGDGAVDLFSGGTSCTIDGKPVAGWAGGRATNGFSSSAADVDGDGTPELFMVTQRHGPNNAVVVGLDHTGKPLKGWPQKVGRKSFAAPSIGNVFGDASPEVILPDHRGHILAWTRDGQRFGNTFVEAQGHSYDDEREPLPAAMLEQEKCTSIFKDNVNCAGPAALADLDGDGLAEIIVIDANTNTLRAWHGDGRGAFGSDDGVIAHVASNNVFGVCVAGPDESGGLDFFAGATWIHRDKSGDVRVRAMAPVISSDGKSVLPPSEGTADTPPDVPETMCQDTVCDIDGDGRADVLIGTSDGRVIVFQTGIAFSEKWAQWPMLGHDVRRSGWWRNQ